MKLKKLYLLLLFTFVVQFIHAQINPPSLSNLRKITVSTKGKTVKLDSLSLVPGSVIMDGVSPYYYKVDEVNATITWLEKPNKDNVTVTYRVFPYKLNAVVSISITTASVIIFLAIIIIHSGMEKDKAIHYSISVI